MKNRIFGPKIGTKIENKVQKLSNSKEKKDFFGQKNKLGLSFRTKKGLFWAKIVKKIEFRYVKNLSEIAKIKQNKSNNGPKKG